MKNDHEIKQAKQQRRAANARFWLLAAVILLAAPACMVFAVDIGGAARATATAQAAQPTEMGEASPYPTVTSDPNTAPTMVEPTATEPVITVTAEIPAGPIPTVTAIVAPTLPPAPTKPPVAPGISLPRGYEVFRHPEMPNFAFPADARVWEIKEDPQWPYAFLVHRDNPSCMVSAVPGRGIGTPTRVLRWQLGRLYWMVLDYGNVGLVNNSQLQDLYLELYDFDSAACRKAQQEVLERVMLDDEITGRQAVALLPTATARPPLPGFNCPNTPDTRLRVGDQAHIVTNDLLLRSKPEATSSTKIRMYDADSPVVIEVIDGPECTEKFVYWRVRVGTIGEGAPDPITGWMAEGDLTEYYLAPGR